MSDKQTFEEAWAAFEKSLSEALEAMEKMLADRKKRLADDNEDNVQS